MAVSSGKGALSQNPVIVSLAGLVLLMVAVYLSVSTFNMIKQGRYIGRAVTERDTITITGEGKVTAVPDIGLVTVSIVNQDRDVARAQESNISKFNAVVAAMKNEGIDSKDLTTTNYSVYPQYDYSDGAPRLTGYEVRQSLAIKIRDLEKSGRIITVAGQNGVNEVSGLTFTFDDPEELQGEAREEALVNARAKAQRLAELAGVSLGKIVSFSESTGGTPVPAPYYDRAANGIGGATLQSAPSLEQGSQDIVVYATIQFEIY